MSIAYSNRLLISNEFLEKHELNNSSIINTLNVFLAQNDLKSSDIIVTGSSCASMMGYFILNRVKDVDVHVKCEKDIVKTKGIDILKVLTVPTDYESRLVFKDGFYFLSEYDLLISNLGSVLIVGKDPLYARLSMINLELDINYLIPIFKETFKALDLPNRLREKVIKDYKYLEYCLSSESLDSQNRYTQNYLNKLKT